MRCDYDFCIYFKNHECILNKIEINNLGMCDSCIRVSFTEGELQEKRNHILESYDNE